MHESVKASINQDMDLVPLPPSCSPSCTPCMQGLDAASSKGLGMSSSSKHGCLFSTYSTLASSRSNAGGKGSGSSKKSRLEQLADW